jgi:hypothetical protein
MFEIDEDLAPFKQGDKVLCIDGVGDSVIGPKSGSQYIIADIFYSKPFKHYHVDLFEISCEYGFSTHRFNKI